MKTKIIIGSVVTFLTLSTFSLSAVAATYQYVNTTGSIQNVEADSASQALATAPNIAPNSGIMPYMVLTTVITNNVGSILPYVSYQYVDVFGQVQTTAASNSNQAFATAINIALHSGVMRLEVNQKGV